MLDDYSEDYDGESPIEFSEETSNVVLSPKTYSDESLGEISEVVKGKYWWLNLSAHRERKYILRLDIMVCYFTPTIF